MEEAPGITNLAEEEVEDGETKEEIKVGAVGCQVVVVAVVMEVRICLFIRIRFCRHVLVHFRLRLIFTLYKFSSMC